MTINAHGGDSAGDVRHGGRGTGRPARHAPGTLQNDILKEYIARGTYIYPPAPSLRLVADVFRFTFVNQNDFNPISISGYHMREAGRRRSRRLPHLATHWSMCAPARSAGLAIDDFAPRLSSFSLPIRICSRKSPSSARPRGLWRGSMKGRRCAFTRRPAERPSRAAAAITSCASPFRPLPRAGRHAVPAHQLVDERWRCPGAQREHWRCARQLLAHETGVTTSSIRWVAVFMSRRLTDRIETQARQLVEVSRGWRRCCTGH